MLKLSLIVFSNTSEGANSGIDRPPVSVSPVFSWSQVVLATSVVGQLIKDPMAIQDIARVDVMIIETLMDRRTVIQKFYALASEVFPFIDPYSVGTTLLEYKRIT